MKGNIKRQVIALMLCMVMMLTSTTSLLANEINATDDAATTEAADETIISEDGTEAQTEEEADIQTLSYEDDTVTITVSSDAEGIIPEGASLRVTPILAEGADTEGIYADVESKLQEKAETEEYEIGGFLAYDISFVDEAGTEIEPNGDVKVNMQYKDAQLPEGTEAVEDTEVTVMHLEEDGNGNVTNVADLSDENVTNGSIEALDTDAEKKVESVEFVTNSFSVYTITWKSGSTTRFTVTLKYVDEDGEEILTGSETKDCDFSNSTTVTFGELADNSITANGNTYNYKEARLNEINGNVVTSASSSSSYYYYYYYYYLTFKNGETQVGDRLETNWQSSKKTATVYLVYGKQSSGGDDSSTETDASITHEKYIKQTDANTYDLTLNVSSSSSSTTEKKKVDILLILDVSGSMNWDMSGKETQTYSEKRIYYLKESINAMVNAFQSNEGADVRYNYVTFAGTASQASGWIDGEELKYKIKDLKADGGTNYQAALTNAANGVKDTWRAGAEKIVVFLTDGEPTYHGTDTRGGGDRTTKEDYEGAITGAKLFSGSYDKFIPIGLGLGGTDTKGHTYGNLSTYGILQRVSYATNGQSSDTNPDKNKIEEPTNVSTGKELKDKFTEIAATTTTTAYKNVSITDTLSQYVATSDTTSFVLKMATKNDAGAYTGVSQETDSSGNNVLSKEVSLSQLMSNSNKQSDGSYQMTVGMNRADGKGTFDTIIKWTPSTDTTLNNGTVTWSLGKTGSEYTLEDGVYYYITLTDLKATDTAKKEFKTNYKADASAPYGNTVGDANTDAKEETDGSKNYYESANTGTSSGQAGFYSNTTNSKVKYTKYTTKTSGNTTTVPGNETKSEDYKKPVIQVDSKELAEKNITFTKLWDDFNDYYNTRPSELYVTLTGTVGSDPNKTTVKTYTAKFTKNNAGNIEAKLVNVATDSNKNTTYTEINESDDGVTVSVVGDATSFSNNTWKLKWNGIPVYYNGTKINWTVTEGTVSSVYQYTGTTKASDNTGTDNTTTAQNEDTTSSSKYQAVNKTTNGHIGLEAKDLATGTTIDQDINGTASSATNSATNSSANTANAADTNTAAAKAASLFSWENDGDGISTASLYNDGAGASDAGLATTSLASTNAALTTASLATANLTSLASDDSGIQLLASNNSRWGGGSSNSGTTFDHIDIEANGSYDFTYGGKTYTLKYWFKSDDSTENAKWKLYDSTGKQVNTGDLDVSSFTITNNNTGANVGVSGKWQRSTTQGVTYEYRISGTFYRSHTFNIQYAIPVVMPDGVAINLQANFDTSYSDGTYNVCPGGGNSKGIDIEMDAALENALKGAIVLTKVWEGLDEDSIPSDLTFTITDENGNSKTITYAEFTNESYVVSKYVWSNIDSGKTFTITEGDAATPEGYTESGTTVSVNGNNATSGKETTVTTTDGMTTVTFTNSYEQKPAKNTLNYQKVWVGGNGSTDLESIDLEVTYQVTGTDGSTSEETKTVTLTKANNWAASEEVDAGTTIKSVTEKTSLSNYASAALVASDGLSAIVTNTYSSSTTTSLTVSKQWNDQNNKYNLRSDSITVQLYKDGTKVTENGTLILNAANNWTGTFTDLVKSETTGDATVTHKYTVAEVTNLADYSTSITYDNDENPTIAQITNTLNTEALDESYWIANKLDMDKVTVTKYWDDNHNEYGNRPASLTVNLTATDGNGQTVTGVTAINYSFGESSEGGNTKDKWVATLTTPKLVSGVTYSASEENITNYECTSSNTTGTNLYFVNKPTAMDLNIQKHWTDADNKYQKRPTSITVTLQRRLKGSTDDNEWATVTEAENGGTYTITPPSEEDETAQGNDGNYWYYTISGLPISENNVEYEYRVIETAVNGYTTTYSGVGNCSIENTFNWDLIKQSSSTDNNGNHPVIGGAEFTLTKADVTETTGTTTEGAASNRKWTSTKEIVAVGVSDKTTGKITWYEPVKDANGTIQKDSNGNVKWYTETTDAEGNTTKTPGTELDLSTLNGTYMMKETKAPAGYALNVGSWGMELDHGIITELNEISVKGETKSISLNAASAASSTGALLSVTVEDTPIYVLPSTGSIGIFWYSIGGVLLMFAAAWILYKNKQNREVLRR